MKSTRFIPALLLLLTLTSCASLTPSSTPNITPELSSPSPAAQAFDEYAVVTYKTREEFHNATIDAKESHNRGASQTSHSKYNLEGITWYYDFQNLVEEVELGEINVRDTYIALDYWNKEDDELGALMIQTIRWNILNDTEYNSETEYLDMLKKRNGAGDTQINGKRVLKQEVYWDNDIFDNYYVCNQYRWIENGYVIFMRIPPWLLELYPEETFFDIQAVEVPAEKVTAE